jgi:hypothetical protein
MWFALPIEIKASSAQVVSHALEGAKFMTIVAITRPQPPSSVWILSNHLNAPIPNPTSPTK